MSRWFSPSPKFYVPLLLLVFMGLFFSGYVSFPIQSFYWLGFAGLLVIGVLFHYFFTRRIKQLLTVVSSLAKGDLQVRSRLSGDDELSKLSTAINEMADKVYDKHARLKLDIAQHKQVELDLMESETRLQQILNNSSTIVYAKALDGTILFANQVFKKMFRLGIRDILGKKDHEALPGKIVDQFNQSDQWVLENKNSIQFEEDVFLNNEIHTFLFNKFPLFNAESDIYAICAIATDINERKQSDRLLEWAAMGVSKASGDQVFNILVAKLATALAVDYAFIGQLTAPDRIETVALWAHGEIVDNINYDLAGSPCETVVRQSFRFYPDRIQSRFPDNELLVEINVEGYAAIPLFNSAGQALGLMATMNSEALKNKALTESIIRIFGARAAGELERNHVDQALRESEASYRSMFDANEDSVFIHNPENGAILDVNPKACETYGYSVEEFRKLNIGHLSSGKHPYTLERADELIRSVEEGKPIRFEWHRKNKDGSLHWDDVCVKKAMIAGQQRVLAFTRDISERKKIEAERLELETQLRQAQKMEAIGQLTGGIAHDFNNILASVLGNAELGVESASDLNHDRLIKYLNNIKQSGERARDLIQQMLTFSCGQRGKYSVIPLAPLILDTVKMMRSTLPSSMEFRTTISPETGNVRCDPIQVEQMLMNLYINARDAMNGIGIVTISLHNQACEGEVCAGCRKAFSGEFVKLIVKDNGAGMEATTLDRIFEPFYTTKEVGKGSGMGLAMVHGIIHDHGGHSMVNTALGKGSTFHILFPVVLEAEEDSSDQDREQAEPILINFSASVLVIDDEELVAEFMADLLVSRGLQVTVMTDSEEAHDLFIKDPGAFDLVITDQTMPKLTGSEIAVKFLQVDPNIPIILYTGHSENLTEETVYQQGIKAYLKKPVNISELMKTIQLLLNDPKAIH